MRDRTATTISWSSFLISTGQRTSWRSVLTECYGDSAPQRTFSCGPGRPSTLGCIFAHPFPGRLSGKAAWFMSRDDPRVADTRAWLRKAADDLRGAEVDLAAAPPLTGDAAFHCQQAAEKALKALLAWHDVPFRKTHDLAELGQQCVAVDQSLERLCRRAASLTPFAWTFRYPGDAEEPSVSDLAEAVALAREVYTSVLARVSEDARP
jgi:HEPN domain-containing protein